MTSAEQYAAGPAIGPTLQPHRYPAWLLAFAALVIAAVVYSATLTPRYLVAALALHRANVAVAAHDRATAEVRFLDALRLVPSSKAARIDIAVLLLSDPSEAQQRRGLDYLTGIKLGKYEWQRVSAVLPDKLRSAFTSTTR
jgi:hypothetical protein